MAPKKQRKHFDVDNSTFLSHSVSSPTFYNNIIVCFQLGLVKNDEKQQALLDFIGAVKKREEKLGSRQKTKILVFVNKPSIGRGLAELLGTMSVKKKERSTAGKVMCVLL